MSVNVGLGPGRALIQRAKQHASLSVLFRTSLPERTGTSSAAVPKSMTPSFTPEVPTTIARQPASPLPAAESQGTHLHPPTPASATPSPPTPAIGPQTTDAPPPAAATVQRSNQPGPPAIPPTGSTPSPVSPSVQQPATDVTLPSSPPGTRQQSPVQRAVTPPPANPSSPPETADPHWGRLQAIHNLHRKRGDDGAELSWEDVKSRTRPQPTPPVQRRARTGQPPTPSRQAPAQASLPRRSEVVYLSPQEPTPPAPKAAPEEASTTSDRPAPPQLPAKSPPAPDQVQRSPEAPPTTPPATANPPAYHERPSDDNPPPTSQPPLMRETAVPDLPEELANLPDATPPIQRTETSANMQPAPTGKPETGAPSPPVTPSTPDTTPPDADDRQQPVSLDQAWSVQRLAEPSPATDTSPSPGTATPPLPEFHHDPEADARVTHVLRQVGSERPSDSTIELVLPRRPRPNPPPAVPAAPSPAIQRDIAEDGLPDSPPATESKMIQTDIGPLPSDLWDLVGDTPPGTPGNPAAPASHTSPASTPPISPQVSQPPSSTPAVARAEAPLETTPPEMIKGMPEIARAPAETADSPLADTIPDFTETNDVQETLPAEPESMAEMSDVGTATDTLAETGTETDPSETEELQEGAFTLYAQEDNAAEEGVVPLLLKRQVEEDEEDEDNPTLIVYADEQTLEQIETTADPAEETEAETETAVPDIDDLARQVYRQVKQRIAVERERARRL